MELHDGIAADWQYDDTEGLTAYLQKAWRERPIQLMEEEDEESRRTSEQRFISFKGKHIKPRNYVGVVQYKGMRLNIYPRVFYGQPGFESQDKIWHVLKWLSYADRVHFPFNNVSWDKSVSVDWLEALVVLFSNFTLKALTTSPHFSYQEVVEEMSFVRGSIAMPKYIRNNLATGRHHLVTCRYEPFIYDNLFNRIVKHTCRFLRGLSRTTTNKRNLDRIVFLLDEVSDEWCTAADCDKVKVNRLYPEVDKIRNVCKMFLLHRHGSGGSNQTNFCLLLPMEVIFEQYVAGFMKKIKPTIQAQSSGMYLARTGENFSTSIFQMRHDIYLPDKMIIDTKYKFRHDEKDGKGGVSQGDVYQVVSYCYRRDIQKGMLLYPKHFGHNATDKKMVLRVDNGKNSPNCIQVDVRSVDITELEQQDFETHQTNKFKSLIN